MKKTANLNYSFQIFADVTCPRCSNSYEIESSGETIENNIMEESLLEEMYAEGWVDDEDSELIVCPECSSEIFGDITKENEEYDNEKYDD